MKNSMFYKLGNLIYNHRILIIILWIITLAISIPFLPYVLTPFKTTGFIIENSKSAKTEHHLNQKIGFNNYNKFIVIYHSKKLVATNEKFIKKIKRSLKKLEHFPLKHIVIYPDENNKQISHDKHTAYVVILIKNKNPINDELLNKIKLAIKKPPQMSMQLGGEAIFIEEVNKQTQQDLFKADLIAAPVAIITLILVFGSLIAALLPVILGGNCAIIILSSLYFLGHCFTLSIFTLNIALLFGLCLSLDYALFVVSRFRDELTKQETLQEAIAATQATAGKAIFFSGLAVFISLSALFFFPINILFSVAVGGMLAVFCAVLAAIILLPAILGILGEKINCLSIHLLSKKHSLKFWHQLADKVAQRPVIFMLPILGLLLLFGYPLLSVKVGVSDYKIFPEQSKNRSFFDTYENKFNINELTPIVLAVEAKDNTILSRHHIESLYDLVHKIKLNHLVKRVDSIVSTKPELTKQQYADFYQLPNIQNQPQVKKLLATTTNKRTTVVDIISKYKVNTPEMTTLVKQLEALKSGHGLGLAWTGTPILHDDMFSVVFQRLPYALLWIIGCTYLILLILLRSVILPLKAISVNLLSLCACYGALVFIFQEGYLAHLLNFQAQGMLDISILVIIFCALFGFSMDYEVFLLTRIKEFYEASGDSKQSIIFGIEKTGRIITSAALIVIFLCASFLVADVLLVKAFGVGIAVAIFIDAFLIRTLLVPSVMVLLKSWNWYLPAWLNQILPKC